MDQRDRNKDRLEAITDRPPPAPPVPASPVETRDPCAEIAAKLAAKRKELEEKQAEIEKLTAESLRAAGLDDVLTPKGLKRLQMEHLPVSLPYISAWLEKNYVRVEDFKDWIKAGMPKKSDREEYQMLLEALGEWDIKLPDLADEDSDDDL